MQNVKRKWFLPAVPAILCCAAAQAQLPPELSQYAPLSVSRQSYLGMSSEEIEIRRLVSPLAYFTVFDHIAYRVDGDVVTLSGHVMNPGLRPDAKRVVRDIEGVRHVYNDIHFLTVSPAENQIRKAVFVAIYGDHALLPYTLNGSTVHIVVEATSVTLEGEVSSERDRQTIAAHAGAVRGVSHVVNHLTVSR